MHADIEGCVGLFHINQVVTSMFLGAGYREEAVPPLRIGMTLWPGIEPLHQVLWIRD